MAGTVKSCVPEPELVVWELVGCGELVACGELVERVAVTEGTAAGEWRWVAEAAGVGDDVGVLVSADVGDSPAVPARAPADPPVAAADAMAEGVDPLVPQALKPAPPMTTAMITAGTPYILMLQPSGK
jgi:hypothetical protein